MRSQLERNENGTCLMGLFPFEMRCQPEKGHFGLVAPNRGQGLILRVAETYQAARWGAPATLASSLEKTPS